MILYFKYSDHLRTFENYCKYDTLVDYLILFELDSTWYAKVIVNSPSPKALESMRSFIRKNNLIVEES